MAVDMIARMMAMGVSVESLNDVQIEGPENGEVLKFDSEQGKWINGTASGGGGTSDYTDLTNKPKINDVTLSGNKSLSDLGIADADDVYTKTESDTLFSTKVDKVSGKGLSENDYTTAEKTKLEGIESGAEVNVQADWAQSDSTADDYIKNKPTIPTVNDATLTIQKNGTTVDTFTANASQNKTINITVPTSAGDVSALPASTKYGATLTLVIDSSTYVVTATLKDQDGNTLGTAQTIDLPLETMVVSGAYDSQTEKIVLTLKNGSTVEFSVAALVSGLQSEITAQSPLDANLVDDTTSTHKFVTAADKSAWNAKSDFSGSYSDLTGKPTLATVATSGSYSDLTNKPTIPSAQVNADWTAASGVAQILHKPTLGAAAAKGVDSAPTASSTNLVESGGVASALAGKQATLTTSELNYKPSLDSSIVATDNNSDFKIYKYGNICFARIALKIIGTVTGYDTISVTNIPTEYRPVYNAYTTAVGRKEASWANSQLKSVSIIIGTDGTVTLATGSDATDSVYISGFISWPCA